VNPPPPFDSWFEVDVALELLRRDFTVLAQHEVAGKQIDLVVEGGQARLAIECDGDNWHGADRYEDDMQRQRQLERCGWEFFRVRESAFYADKSTALEKLWSMLEERGIFPGSCFKEPHAKINENPDNDEDEQGANEVFEIEVAVGEIRSPAEIAKEVTQEFLTRNSKHICFWDRRSKFSTDKNTVDAPIARVLSANLIAIHQAALYAEWQVNRISKSLIKDWLDVAVIERKIMRLAPGTVPVRALIFKGEALGLNLKEEEEE